MAIYHFSVKNISRSDGRSAVACSAYRSGEKLIDERQGKEQDYTKKTGVEFTRIYAPENTNPELLNRNELWNKVEQVENRKNSQLAREFEIAFPHELNQQQREQMLNELCQDIVKRHGVVVDAAIHAPHTKSGSDERNYHAHIMLTTRSIDEHGNLGKKTREFNDTGKQEVEFWREKFADIANKHLARAGYLTEIDHRSYTEQNNGLQATMHEGSKVTQLRRQGIFTEISLKNDEIKLKNLEIKKVIVLDKNISVSEDLVKQLQSQLDFKNAETKYLEKVSLKLSELQNEELSKLKTELNMLNSEISEIQKKEPLFFKTKWSNQINELIDQYNAQIDFQNQISCLSETEKQARYFEQLNKWIEENQLLQPKKSFEIFDMQSISKQQEFNDQISNIDQQISEISHRQAQHQEYIRNQIIEIRDSYIFEEDNYGNKYFSPKNGDKQKRLYAEELEESRRIAWYENFRKSLEEEVRQNLAQRREQQLENERQIQRDNIQKELELRKQQAAAKQLEQLREPVEPKKLEKEPKIETKKPDNDQNFDFSP